MNIGLEIDFILEKGYTIKTKLGKGGFSLVYKAIRTHRGEKIGVAIKITERTKGAFKEPEILRTLNHSNIVRYVEHFSSRDFDYMVMELCSTDLEEYVRRAKRQQSETMVKIIMQQLTLAVQFLHEKRISHRDIKPRNVLMCTSRVYVFKLTDFGLSESYDLSKKNCEMDIFPGTIYYMAPERLNRKFRIESDLWSLGVLMFRCLFGVPAFFKKPLETILSLVNSEKLIQIPESHSISPICDDLMRKLLVYNPDERITFEELFQHPFLDLENMPSTENFEKVLVVLTEAETLDKEGQYQEALLKYEEFLAQIQMYLTITQRDSPKWASYAQMRNKYHVRVLEIRKQFVNYIEEDLDRLRSLVKSTPSLATGLEIAMSGEEYAKEGRIDLARAKLTEALDILMPAFSHEPPGHRKSLLLPQLNKWVAYLENLQEDAG